MRLKSLSIKNFKGIDEQGITIDFAPITLLFGPNNAGKSTVIQALHLAREVFCEQKPDLNRLEKYGKAFNLGSFKDYVHKHDLNRTVSIKLEYDDIVDIPLSSNIYSWLEDFTFMEFDELIEKINSFSFILNISWDFSLKNAVMQSFTIEVNSEKLTTISLHHRENKIEITNDGFSLLPFLESDEIDNIHVLVHQFSQDENIDENTIIEALSTKMPQYLATFFDLNSIVFDNIIDLNYQPSTIQGLIQNYYELWNNTMNFSIQNGSNNSSIIHELNKDGLDISYNEFFTRLICKTGQKISKELEKLLYIGPIREIPARGPRTPERITHSRWADGLAAWDKILYAPPNEIDSINDKLKLLGLPYIVEIRNKIDVEEDVALTKLLMSSITEKGVEENFDNATNYENLREKIQEFLNNEPALNNKIVNLLAAKNLNRQIYLEHQVTKTLTEPHDMGLGISQVIPFIVAMEFVEKYGMIAIEQPELHIHPKLQVNLGDVIIESALKSDNRPFFLIETHSEHLLLRLLRRIRNTSEGSAKENEQLTPSDVAVNWVGPTPTYMDVDGEKHQTYACRLLIDEEGTFNAPWPEGFFDERGEELFS